MKKLYIVLIALFTLITLPGLQTQGASYTGNDVAIADLNGLTLNQVFRDGNDSDVANYAPISSRVQILSNDGNEIISKVLNNASSYMLATNTTYNISINDIFYINLNYKLENTTLDLFHRFSTSGGSSLTLPFNNNYSNISGILQSAVSGNFMTFGRVGLDIDAIFYLKNIYHINITLLGISTLTQNQLDYWFNQWQQNNAYIEGYDQGELDGYADGLQDNTAYIQGYNVGYTDGLTEAVDVETGSSIIVLVVGAIGFIMMIFGFTTRRGIFNLLSVGAFIVLGGLLAEFIGFIIIAIGLVIINVYYAFWGDL